MPPASSRSNDSLRPHVLEPRSAPVGRVHLSGAICVQNNAGHIATVMENLAAYCDEIVVVDGGSTDGTQDVCSAYPKVRLFERPWDDNFSRQKNYAYDRCRGRWILNLDSDELLGGPGIGWLRALTHVPGANWYSIPRLWLVRGEDGQLGYLASRRYWRDRQLRLFRNTPGFRYDEVRTPTHTEFAGKHGFGRPLRKPYLYHYTFLMQSREEREAKVARYDAARPQDAELNRMYLWEESGSSIADLPHLAPGDLADQFTTVP